MLGALMTAFFGAAVAHPVYPPPEYTPAQVESLKHGVASAMAMTPKELYDFVPVCSGIYFCGCPNCDGGSQEHAMTWELGMGDTVKCTYCAQTFPNDAFPNNREHRITAPSGVEQVYRWYEDGQGRQFHFEARAWYDRWEWTRSMALNLAYLRPKPPVCGPRRGGMATWGCGRISSRSPAPCCTGSSRLRFAWPGTTTRNSGTISGTGP